MGDEAVPAKGRLVWIGAWVVGGGAFIINLGNLVEGTLDA